MHSLLGSVVWALQTRPGRTCSGAGPPRPKRLTRPRARRHTRLFTANTTRGDRGGKARPSLSRPGKARLGGGDLRPRSGRVVTRPVGRLVTSPCASPPGDAPGRKTDARAVTAPPGPGRRKPPPTRPVSGLPWAGATRCGALTRGSGPGAGGAACERGAGGAAREPRLEPGAVESLSRAAPRPACERRRTRRSGVVGHRRRLESPRGRG